MNSSTKLMIAIAVPTLAVVGCCFVGILVGRQPAVMPPYVLPAGAAGTAPAGGGPAVAPPLVGPNAWEMVNGKFATGQTPTPTECAAALRAMPMAYDPAVWRIFSCGLNGSAPNDEIYGGVFRILVMMRSAHVQQPPPEAASLVAGALDRLKADPSFVLGPGYSEPISDVTSEDLTAASRALDEIALVCPACVRARPVRDARRTIEDRIANYPVFITSVNELQLRYDDLRERNVQIVGAVVPDTYYNCKYRSTSTWRSFRFAQNDNRFPRMNVYCRADSSNCQDTYAAAVRGGVTVGTAIIRYPSSNSICEQEQAELVFFQANP